MTVNEFNLETLDLILEHLSKRFTALDQWLTSISPNDPNAKEKAMLAAAGAAELKMVVEILKDRAVKAKELNK